jgi:hypothetical protein
MNIATVVAATAANNNDKKGYGVGLFLTICL